MTARGLLANRVTPRGILLVVPARCALMGNNARPEHPTRRRGAPMTATPTPGQMARMAVSAGAGEAEMPRMIKTLCARR